MDYLISPKTAVAWHICHAAGTENRAAGGAGGSEHITQRCGTFCALQGGYFCLSFLHLAQTTLVLLLLNLPKALPRPEPAMGNSRVKIQPQPTPLSPPQLQVATDEKIITVSKEKKLVQFFQCNFFLGIVAYF